MIAATFTQGGTYRVQDVPPPQAADDELLLRIGASSICGTDLRMIRNGHRKMQPGQTVVLGHEFAGVVEHAGPRVTGFAVGQRVGVAPNIGCGRCEMCAAGLPNMCPDYEAFGITFDGGHTEQVRIPAGAIAQGSVVPLPDALPLWQASLIEPFSCVVNAQQTTRIDVGDVVVIVGAGPIGLMHLLLALVSGAAQVIVADVRADRLAQAVPLGATSTIAGSGDELREHVMQRTAGRGADVVITACSVPEVQAEAVEVLAPFGRLCLFGGLPADRRRVSLDTNAIHYKSLLVTGTTGGAPRDFRTAMRLIASGRVDVTRVVSHRFAANQLDQAFDVALNQETLKVVIDREM